MGETWYRGEVAGAAPAKPGAWLHDIGEGMYLTDRRNVAEAYGPKRAVDPSTWRVYRAEIDLKGMRVLDLRTDPRWKESTSIKGVSFIERVVKSGGNEQYAKIFQNFLAQHKINLAQYDAVIGPEYVNGGNQICILNKGNQPSALAARIRATFRLDGPRVAARSSAKVTLGEIRFRGRFGQGLRVAGGSLALFGVGLLISILGHLLLQKINRQILEKKLRALQPRIDADAQTRRKEVLALLADGKKAFANARFSVVTAVSLDPEAGPVSSVPSLQYHGLTVSDKEINKQGPMQLKPVLADKWEHLPVTMSFPLTMPKEEVEAFATYRNALALYDEEIRRAQNAAEKARLTAEKVEAERQFQRALGL
jgi:hypothetical protein